MHSFNSQNTALYMYVNEYNVTVHIWYVSCTALIQKTGLNFP